MVTLRATPVLQDAPASRGLSPALFTGIAVASIGGPLALAALYVPGIVGDDRASAGLMVVLASAVFGLPLLIWCLYSRRVVGAGGLYSFTEAAAGRRVAQVQSGFWILSYLLYLLYTVDDVSYNVLPAVIPGVTPYRPVLEIALPLVVTALVLAPLVVSASVLTGVAVGQLVLVGALAATTIGDAGAPAGSFVPHVEPAALASGTGNIALLYVCASLPIFLGGEVAGGARTVRRGLVAAYGIAVVALLVAVFPLAATHSLGDTPIPGMALAHVSGQPALGTAIGLGVAASTLALVAIEYLALTRLLHAVSGRPVRRMARWLVVPFVAANALSLLSPERFYDALLRPSLIALWVAQLITVAVYPAYAARHRRLRPLDVALAVGACCVMLFGLYSTTVNQVAT
jgi:hypothetical protein